MQMWIFLFLCLFCFVFVFVFVFAYFLLIFVKIVIVKHFEKQDIMSAELTADIYLLWADHKSFKTCKQAEIRIMSVFVLFQGVRVL